MDYTENKEWNRIILDLLSENEHLAVISSFDHLLNSLSMPIQKDFGSEIPTYVDPFELNLEEPQSE